MPPTISPARREQLIQCIQDGFSVKAAAARVGMGYSTARGIVKGLPMNPEEMRKEQAKAIERNWREPVAYDDLCDEAKAALHDITVFARRYFGFLLLPWHVEATQRVTALWGTDRKEYVVINLPPGVGKSTFFTLVLPAWLTCRDRNIRGLIGSAADSTAKWYTGRLRDAFTAVEPIVASDDDKRRGLAVDAEATLLQDFGLFKPEGDDGKRWTQASFDVRTLGGQRRGEKEHTWQSFGKGQTFIGSRVPFTIWDDVFSLQDNKTPEARKALKDWWTSTAESRLEPGGLLILQGQRLHPDDIYAFALSIESGGAVDIYDDGLEEDADGNAVLPEDDPRAGMKYHHIVFKAHYEDRCQGDCTPCRSQAKRCPHQKGEQPFHGDADGKHCNGDGTHCRYAPPYPAGCLLYPGRLPWSEIATLMKDRRMFKVVYQQEDDDEEQHLVRPLWIEGGVDEDSKEQFVGCYDDDRELGELPRNLQGPFKRYVTIDPSPTEWWAVEDWLYDEDTQQRFLINLERKRFKLPDLLHATADGRLGGLFPGWQARSMLDPVPIGTWIVEQNNGNRFLLQLTEMSRFQQLFGVDVRAHDTYRNKTDPKYGVTSIATPYRHGRKRLPNKGIETRALVGKFVDELTHWPNYRTDDLVMADWFGEFALPNLPYDRLTGGNANAPQFDTMPSWMNRRTG